MPRQTWHPTDQERGAKPWSVTILRALNPDGTVLWPGMMSLDAYADLYNSGGSALFLATRMQDPSGLAGAVFRPEWFQWYVHADYRDARGTTAQELLADGQVQAILPPPEALIPGLAADLAISQEETADNYARAMGYGDALGNIWIEDVIQLGQRDLTPEKMLDDLIFTATGKQVRTAGLESTHFQALMSWLVNKTAPSIPWRDLGPRGAGKTGEPGKGRLLDKVTRARMGLQPAYERRKVYHRLDMPKRQEFETTLIGFPGAAHDDMVDAVMYLWECLHVIDPGTYQDVSDLMQELRTRAGAGRFTNL